jgi:hypothetical protein
MSEWQPIETAPKDEVILVYDGDDIYMAEWDDSFNSRGWRLYIDGARLYRTTHWMPLPEPPK